MGSLLPSKDAKASFSSADIETGVGTVLQNAPLRSLTRVDVFFHLFLLLVVVVVLFSSGFSMLSGFKLRDLGEEGKANESMVVVKKTDQNRSKNHA